MNVSASVAAVLLSSVILSGAGARSPQSTADSAATGVLVGLERHGEDRPGALPGTLRTIWIPIPGAATGASETIEVADLLVPRRTGF
jgi:hypothetical protein